MRTANHQVTKLESKRESVNQEPEHLENANAFDRDVLTDEAVFSAFVAGDTTALGLLYDRYGVLVYRLVYRMLGNAQEAEDLTQDIFLNLQVKSKFDPQRGSFYTYLMTITRSRAIDRLRSRRSRGKFWQNIGKLKDAIAGQKMNNPLEVASTEEISTQVKAALQKLSTKQRQVLQLSYYEGLSQSEIAKRLNLPLGTVKTHSRRGLIQLRKNLHSLVNQGHD